MPLTFTQIANALDDFVDMDEDTRADCVHSAGKEKMAKAHRYGDKRRWRRCDMIPGTNGYDQVPSVAVSITDALAKVRADAQAIADRGVKIDFLVF